MEKIKLKKLLQMLQKLDTFETPKEHLEQYQTTPEVSANLLMEIYLTNHDSFFQKSILDLGCGNGTLGIAAALCGAG